MNSMRFKKYVLLTLVLAFVLACAPFSAGTPQPEATLDALYTAAAQTLNSMSTQGAVALASQPAPTGTLSIPTSTALVFSTYTIVPPVQPVSQCDAASFIADISYPDGSSVARGTTFTKIWRIKNVGTCTWTTSYALVYASGEKFGAQTAVSLPGNIGPGQNVDLPIQLTAPDQNGRFKGYWSLRNASGVLFGVGASAQEKIYVDVNVTGYTIVGYDFLDKYCDAEWRNESQNLPCPGTDGDGNGFVLAPNSPKMENGNVQNKGLITHPQKINDGLITGKYPAITIQSGDRFQAWINCMYLANDCNMIFKLQYQIGNGNVRTLGQWTEIYEGGYYAVNIDLSGLDGQKVKFILSILANGSPHEDYGLWIAPRITRLSAQPPTATSTTSLTPTTTGTATSTGTATATATVTSTATGTASPTSTATATDTPTATATATP